MLANLADSADNAYCAFELGVILGSIKRTLFKRCAAVDGCVAGSADLEFGKLVELDLHRVVGIALTLSLGLPGLFVC
jgi:hypothetical protein